MMLLNLHVHHLLHLLSHSLAFELLLGGFVLGILLHVSLAPLVLRLHLRLYLLLLLALLPDGSRSGLGQLLLVDGLTLRKVLLLHFVVDLTSVRAKAALELVRVGAKVHGGLRLAHLRRISSLCGHLLLMLLLPGFLHAGHDFVHSLDLVDVVLTCVHISLDGGSERQLLLLFLKIVLISSLVLLSGVLSISNSAKEVQALVTRCDLATPLVVKSLGLERAVTHLLV